MTVAARFSCVVLSLICCCATAACGNAQEQSAGHRGDATPVAAEYYASEYGVRVGVRVTFPEDRRVTGAHFIWDGRSQKVPLYPLDGTDPDSPPETLDLAHGVGLLLEQTVVAPCPDAPSLPVFEVSSVRDGQKITERYTPKDTPKFRNAFQQWCGMPFVISLAGMESTPDGDCTYWLTLHNPGPFTVVVVSEGHSAASWAWQSAKATVPAGTIGRLTLHGHGDPPKAPWESGHLLANGRPIGPGGGKQNTDWEQC
jgi:hypothetical protein